MNISKALPLIAISLAISLTLATSSAEAALKCYDCHGSSIARDIRPVDWSYRHISSGGVVGNHRTHVSFGASEGRCTACHPGSNNYDSAHRDGMIKLSPHLNLSQQVTTYNNRTTAWPQTATPEAGNCTNVNCHFENLTPRWGEDRSILTCTSCHSTPPLDGSHGKKHGEYFGTAADSCTRCHNDHLAEANVFSHASAAGKRGIKVQFTTPPNSGGSYTGGTTSYPDYLPRLSPARNGNCTDLYCHSDGRGGPPVKPLTWSDAKTTDCYTCHRGRTVDSTPDNCAGFGAWSTARGYCTPDLTMSSNGHHRLVGPQWIRKYPCYYCHNATVDATGNLRDRTKHVNGEKNIAIYPEWNITNRPPASYDPATKVCDNIYCHSDGTTDPEDVRPFAWTAPKTSCNTCHGHPVGSCANSGCHDGRIDPVTGKVWAVKTGWPAGNEWMSAMPMFPNQGAGTSRANSHPRHIQTSFTCDTCHAETIINGACTSCHSGGVPTGSMNEVSHLNGANHVNKRKDVAFKDGAGSYNSATKSCSGTSCHTGGTDPVWGGSVNSAITCLGCHRTTGPDQDDFAAFNGVRAKINQQEWETTGHGRYSSSGRYPVSGNPAANFPGNPCWYCHDNSVLHNYSGNPYRLQMHHQYERRFEKECVYCHMERIDAECIGCHVGQAESLAPQATGGGIVFKYKFHNLSTITRYPAHSWTSGCLASGSCHDSDSGIFPGGTHKGHDVNAGIWTTEQKTDVKNQYMMMGVCLQCHDDDSGGQCTECHTAPAGNPNKYSLGFNPGTGFIKPKKARATSAHFGYKHYRAFLATGGWTRDGNGKAKGTWKGGKFCWDCHDPHGDSNIYMIQKKVATSTDGKFGIPVTRADVTFVDKASGTSYARKTAPFDGICNVCHSPNSKHYTSSSGDGHNYTRVCTTCHEHRFADSHANRQACNSCHSNNKPIPKHTAFGLPRDCTKCHSGTVGKRMDVMGQMKANSHHVQGVEVTNKHCYACHWEATAEGLIDTQHHTGYNYKTYTSVKNDSVDLVVWGPGVRPTSYRQYSTAEGRATVTRFLAAGIGTPGERTEVGKITNHCLACHSDQNNDTEPFGDYRRPRQYAWDYQSVASRYTQQGTTAWGKYNSAAYPNANRKDTVTKALSAHGNAVQNQGGWSPATGYDGTIPPTRGVAGAAGVQCFDCHNSHGSKVVGTTTSYVTFNGTNNGGNLKETKQNIGGYAFDYKASANNDGVNPFGSGAGQCFDCHNSAAAGTPTPNGKTPWGYNSTFGATAPILGYKDTERFGQGIKGSNARYAERSIMQTIVGGHLKASEPGGALPHLAKETGSATGGGVTSLSDSAKGWTTDRWKNLYLQMTGGANAGQMRQIAGNSATTLSVEPFTSPVAPGDSYQIVPYTTTVNGICTPCHDPHGVSRTLGDNQAYAVPLLKGTWLTSPYREDQPAPDPSGYGVTPGPDGTPRSWGAISVHPEPTQPSARYNIDRTTFGGSTRISEADDRFAGLCTNCHQKQALTDGTNKNQNWKTVDRIHEAVKGWGANTEHSYSCSKCHQPHNSGLPRLMQTNCLDGKHRGNRVSGGTPWRADSQGSAAIVHANGDEHRGYPVASTYGNSASYEATTSCHGSAPLNSGSWPEKNLWNSVTPW
jgi:predicted CxxxxCH...CXXCH cytochrome family protein